MKKKDVLAYIGIGDAGVYGHYLPRKTEHGEISGSFQSYGKDLSEYYPQLMQGGYVIDKSKVHWEELLHHVLSGPMCNLSLPEGTINKASSRENIQTQEPSEAGSMDYVSLDLYLILCRRLKGCRIGKRVKKQIRWEDGSVEEIHEQVKEEA